MNIPDHISESSETILWVKILKFFDADLGTGNRFDPGSGIRDGKSSDPGYGMNTRIRNTARDHDKDFQNCMGLFP
jgi:hypothetical protein